MKALKFSERFCCSSPIDPELSMTNKTSTSLLTEIAMPSSSSIDCSYSTRLMGWSRQAKSAGNAAATATSTPARVASEARFITAVCSAALRDPSHFFYPPIAGL